MWDVPPGPIRLPADELHVWRVPLDLNPEAIESLSATLASDERIRAVRFHLPCDRSRFIAARGSLRALLARTLDRDPAALAFVYGPHGKPSLSLPLTSPRLAFNLSHSGEYALIVLRWGADVGIDIEQMRDDRDWWGVANRFYSATERALLHSLPLTEQTAGFFRLWARKEAYIKARGGGLWHDLSRLDVTQDTVPEESPAPDANAFPWHLQDLHPGGHCQAAVCAQGPLPILRTWQWEPSTR